MKNISRVTAVVLAATVLSMIAIAGCTGNKNANTVNTTNSANNTVKNSNAENRNSAANTGTAPAFSLATPTDAYKTAYALRQKGDIEGLKKVMSKDALEFMTMIGKEEKRTLDDELRETVKTPQGPSDEVRNEKITGDTATLEYLKDKDNWGTMDFVKEGNDWKLTTPKGGPGKKPKQPE